jgi:hypothetical protein
LIFIIIFLIKNLFIIVFNYFFINYICKLNVNISNRLFYSCLRQDYIFFLKRSKLINYLVMILTLSYSMIKYKQSTEVFGKILNI